MKILKLNQIIKDEDGDSYEYYLAEETEKAIKLIEKNKRYPDDDLEIWIPKSQIALKNTKGIIIEDWIAEEKKIFAAENIEFDGLFDSTEKLNKAKNKNYKNILNSL